MKTLLVVWFCEELEQKNVTEQQATKGIGVESHVLKRF
jgi:hypothetical protein